MALTPKQTAFVNEYVVCRNGAEAARRAQYAVPSARVKASQLLTLVNIQAAVAAKEEELAMKLDLDRDTVMAGVFSGITQARENNDAGNVIRGWLAVGKITGFDKPDRPKSDLGSVTDGELQAKFDAMSDEELLAIAEGRVVFAE
jgi:phage terminase small subunit